MASNSAHDPSPPLLELGNLVEQVAPIARELWHELARVPPIAKPDGSPVTVADFVVQAIIVFHLLRKNPSDGFICEENSLGLLGSARNDALELFLQSVHRACGPMSDAATLALLDAPAPTGRSWWLIDPIDGTAGFIAGSHFSVCVARVSEGETETSAVGCPRLGNSGTEPGIDGPGLTVIAERTKGAWAIDRQGTRSLRRAPWVPPVRWARSVNRKQLPMRLQPVVDALGLPVESLPIDSQCKYALLALDRADLALRLPRASGPEHAWDHVAGALAAHEAGLTVTDIGGAELNAGLGALMSTNCGILCAPPALHGQLVQLLAPFAGSARA